MIVVFFALRAPRDRSLLVGASTGYVTTPALKASKLKTNTEVASPYVLGCVAVQFWQGGNPRSPIFFPGERSWDERLCRFAAARRDMPRVHIQTPCFGQPQGVGRDENRDEHPPPCMYVGCGDAVSSVYTNTTDLASAGTGNVNIRSGLGRTSIRYFFCGRHCKKQFDKSFFLENKKQGPL